MATKKSTPSCKRRIETFIRSKESTKRHSFCSTRQPSKQSVNQEKMTLSMSYYILLNIQKNMS
jgi:uncharacterized protein YaaW (UPF0174 family)